MSETAARKPLLSKKKLVLLGFFLGLALLSFALRKSGIFDPLVILEWIRRFPTAAPAIFVGIYAVSVALLLPTLPLNLGAGVIWGPWWGGVVAVLGSFLGSMLAFLVARTALGTPLAERMRGKLLAWLQTEIETCSWQVVAFTRLNPVFPGIINFLFGMTAVRSTTFTWATLVFLFPPTMLFAALGHGFGDVILTGELKSATFIILGISAFVVLLTVWWGRKRYKAGAALGCE